MAEVYSLSLSNGLDTLTVFKKELLKDHKENYIIALDEAINKLRLFGFEINQKWKRDSLKNLIKNYMNYDKRI